jgi:hypothetical protein
LPYDYAAIRAGVYELPQVETRSLVSTESDLAIRLSICQIEQASSSSLWVAGTASIENDVET